MKSYGYSPAWGVVRTEPQPLPTPPEPEPEPLPEDPPQSRSRTMATTKWDRMRQLAEWRLHTGPEAIPPPGTMTAREAARRLGVSTRVIWRYKRELAQLRAAS